MSQWQPGLGPTTALALNARAFFFNFGFIKG